MDSLLDFITYALAQVGGGPGAEENNLARYGLAAIFWSVLLVVALRRQRNEARPRERLLALGFGIALLQELIMLAHHSRKLMSGSGHDPLCNILQPVGHALGLMAIVVIGAAFLRYILDEPHVAQRFLAVGLGLATLGFLATSLWWPQQLLVTPSLRFHNSWLAGMLHLVALALMAAAIILLARAHSWLRNLIWIAFGLFFTSELLILLNLVTGRVFAEVLCPLANNAHIWAIPVFGYVYLREQAIEKEQAKDAILAYRQRVAAEMHDGLAQSLSFLALKTSQAANLLESGNASSALAEVRQIQEAVDHAVGDVRRSIAILHEGPPARQSLQDALRSLVDTQPGSGNAPVELQCAIPTALYLPGNTLEQALRVVQEALLNAHRHAQARQITISLEEQDRELAVVIQDDGRGFDPNGLSRDNGNHFGLNIMQVRAAHIGGRVLVDSRPGQGTRVILRWPTETRPATPEAGLLRANRRRWPTPAPDPQPERETA